MSNSPKLYQYCEAIINRWGKYSGKDAILESTGKTYKETVNE